jgi:hypothetical protein
LAQKALSELVADEIVAEPRAVSRRAWTDDYLGMTALIEPTIERWW